MSQVQIKCTEASITRGGSALILNGTYCIRSQERISLGIYLPNQAVGKTFSVIDNGKVSPTGLHLVDIDLNVHNVSIANAQVLEIVRVNTPRLPAAARNDDTSAATAAITAEPAAEAAVQSAAEVVAAETPAEQPKEEIAAAA